MVVCTPEREENKIISVYSAYRVPQDSLPGPFMTYAQQYKILTNNDVTDPRSRRRMINDLIKEIKSKQDAGNQIILGIDANEVLEPDGTPVKKTKHHDPETRVRIDGCF